MRYFPQLETRTAGQYPLRRERHERVVKHESMDGRLRTYYDGNASRVGWVLQYEGLTDGERGPITGAIGEKTADAIRDLLTPAQREKYNPPRPDTGRPKPEQAKDLSRWLDAMQQK